MSKSKKYVITSEQIFDFRKPKWNGFACGYGIHGKTKYSRKSKYKKGWKEVE